MGEKVPDLTKETVKNLIKTTDNEMAKRNTEVGWTNKLYVTEFYVDDNKIFYKQ